MRITVIGAGYVGLTVSGAMGAMGHTVTCVEKDSVRLTSLQQGTIPFFEPGLQDLLDRGIRSRRLDLTSDPANAIAESDIVIVAVGTPASADGTPDLAAVREVADSLTQTRPPTVIVIKSTVPVGTTDALAEFLRMRGCAASIACNPEFLSEGSAVANFFHPYRVVIGTRHEGPATVLRQLYQELSCPIIVTDPPTAEMIKYASNAFLAARISFINEMAVLCERVGADIATVASGMGHDPRIGSRYLQAGIGFGGSCLPKDLRALTALARGHDVPLEMVEATLRVNNHLPEHFITKIDQAIGPLSGKKIGVMGLAFKPGTSDVRESPALEVIRRLLLRGASVKAFDPAAESDALRVIPALICCPTPYEAAAGANAVVILTDWPEFEELDWMRLRHIVQNRIILDGRGLGIARQAIAEGFTYVGPSTPVQTAVLEPIELHHGF